MSLPASTKDLDTRFQNGEINCACGEVATVCHQLEFYCSKHETAEAAWLRTCVAEMASNREFDKCSICGTEIDECPNCGSSQKDEEDQDTCHDCGYYPGKGLDKNYCVGCDERHMDVQEDDVRFECPHCDLELIGDCVFDRMQYVKHTDLCKCQGNGNKDDDHCNIMNGCKACDSGCEGYDVCPNCENEAYGPGHKSENLSLTAQETGL